MGVVQSYKGIGGRVDKNEGGRLRVGKWERERLAKEGKKGG